jgi:ABC-type lipoprotein release transport system permease subunit
VGRLPAVVLAAVAAAILITLVSAHCLARRATRLDPADALTPL